MNAAVYTFTTAQPIREMVADAIVRAELAKVRLYAVLKWVLDNAKRILSRIKATVAAVTTVAKYSDYLTNYDSEWPAAPYQSPAPTVTPPTDKPKMLNADKYISPVMTNGLLVPVTDADIRAVNNHTAAQIAKTERLAKSWQQQAKAIGATLPSVNAEQVVKLSNTGKDGGHRGGI